MARKMGFDAVSLSLSIDSITACVRRSEERATSMREIGPPAINASRIAELEQLAREVESASSPHEIGTRLSQIESTVHYNLCSSPQPSA
jgi:uncharacterized membrane protein YjjP (DUF1212 family)